MKIFGPILRLFFSVCSFSGQGQPIFIFENYSSIWGIDAPVSDASGTLLYGDDYLAALYGGTSADSLLQGVRAYTANETLRVPFTFTPNGQHGHFNASTYDRVTCNT